MSSFTRFYSEYISLTLFLFCDQLLYQFFYVSLDENLEAESDSEHDDLIPDTYYDNIEINEEDEEALKMFMSLNPEKTRTLADIIKEKITEKNTELQTQFSDAETMKMQNIDPR